MDFGVQLWAKNNLNFPANFEILAVCLQRQLFVYDF